MRKAPAASRGALLIMLGGVSNFTSAVYLATLTAPQPAPPAFVSGHTLAVGDVTGFTYSPEVRLAMLTSSSITTRRWP